MPEKGIGKGPTQSMDGAFSFLVKTFYLMFRIINC